MNKIIYCFCIVLLVFNYIYIDRSTIKKYKQKNFLIFFFLLLYIIIIVSLVLYNYFIYFLLFSLIYINYFLIIKL